MQTLEPNPFFDKLGGGAYDFIKKETLAQGFSCEFSEIFENTFFTEHFQEPSSVSGPTSLNVLELMRNELEKTFSKSI